MFEANRAKSKSSALPVPTGALTERIFDRSRAISAALLASSIPVIVGLLLAFGLTPDVLYRLFIFNQDLALVPVFVVAYVLHPRRQRTAAELWRDPGPFLLSAIMLALVLVGWLGHYFILSGYHLSRDEKMAVFDTEIFSNGSLFWEIPADWRSVADAFNMTFMLPIGNREAWVSAYLPIHAMFRALVGQVGDAALASPLLAALAAFLIWRIAAKLWPGSQSTRIVSLLLFISSSQVLVTSMTAFSMTMHLALNLLWLTLFLADRPSTHMAAIIVGFAATGIHQPLFHPLFVAPFLMMLVQQARWKLVVSYVLAYAVIAAFWLAWPLWISAQGTSAPVLITGQSIGFVDRLVGVLAAPGPESLVLSFANFLRFIVWQHPLLAPLAIFGAITTWRSDPIGRALALGFILPVLLMALLLPWQGHGWGYRYVHPVLGNAILLACYGWYRLKERGLSFDRPMVAMTALSILVLFPVHCWMANQAVAPLLAVQNDLASIDADVVIVDVGAAPLGDNVVYNPPDLSARPILLMASHISPNELTSVCKRRTIAFFKGTRLKPINELYKGRGTSQPTQEIRQLERAAAAKGCTVNQQASASR